MTSAVSWVPVDVHKRGGMRSLADRVCAMAPFGSNWSRSSLSFGTVSTAALTCARSSARQESTPMAWTASVACTMALPTKCLSEFTGVDTCTMSSAS